MKECIIITSHLRNEDQIKITKQLLLDLDQMFKSEVDILMVGNAPIPTELQELATYTFSIKDNPIDPAQPYIYVYHPVPVFGNEDNVEMCNLGYIGGVNYFWAALDQIKKALQFAIGLKYEYAHVINYDTDIHTNPFYLRRQENIEHKECVVSWNTLLGKELNFISFIDFGVNLLLFNTFILPHITKEGYDLFSKTVVPYAPERFLYSLVEKFGGPTYRYKKYPLDTYRYFNNEISCDWTCLFDFTSSKILVRSGLKKANKFVYLLDGVPTETIFFKWREGDYAWIEYKEDGKIYLQSVDGVQVNTVLCEVNNHFRDMGHCVPKSK